MDTNRMKNIILTGYMGSGKTTIGKNVAKIKEYLFVDTDEMIASQQHRSISEIFAVDGEQAFRDMETALLRRMVDDKIEHMVLSTGGGMPLRAENRQLLSELGIVIYLKASPETIYSRIKGNTARPLLQCENPMKRIEEMIAERGPLYEEGAGMIINVDGIQQSEVAEQCVRAAEQIEQGE